MATTEHEQEMKKFREMVSTIRMATLVTISTDQQLRGRPMSTAEVDEDGNIWFFTNEFTEKVDEIERENKVLLSYASRSDNSYVMVNGAVSLVKDAGKMESLWNDYLKAWFPDGLNDPKLMLLKVQPLEIEYWDGSANKIAVGFKIVRALLKGEQYKDGEHNKIVLS